MNSSRMGCSWNVNWEVVYIHMPMFCPTDCFSNQIQIDKLSEDSILGLRSRLGKSLYLLYLIVINEPIYQYLFEKEFVLHSLFFYTAYKVWTSFSCYVYEFNQQSRSNY